MKRCCPDELARLTDGDEVKSSLAFERKESGARDPTTLCFICGKRFGSAGLGRHTRACAARWTDQLLPALERLCESLPQMHDPYASLGKQ